MIGFGLGVMARKNEILAPAQFEIAIILSLILGGFFLALGLPGKRIDRGEEVSNPGNGNLSQN